MKHGFHLHLHTYQIINHCQNCQTSAKDLWKVSVDHFYTKVALTYLMIEVPSFQFQNKTLKSFSKWCILMDKCRPRFEVWRIFQQYLSVIYHVVLVVNSELRALEFKVFKVNIFLSFFVHFNRFFFQLVFSSPVSSISTSIHCSPIAIKTKTIKQKPWI